MFTQDRNAMRQYMMGAWEKYKTKQPIEPLERIIAEEIAKHPEYYSLFESSEKTLQKDFIPEFGETNPFLHISMHIAIVEQLSIDRPVGLRAEYHRLITDCGGDVHAAEHEIMECLAETLWRAQRSGSAPDEVAYLENVKARKLKQ